MVGVTQRHSQELVGQDRAEVSKAKKRVVSENLQMTNILAI